MSRSIGGILILPPCSAIAATGRVDVRDSDRALEPCGAGPGHRLAAFLQRADELGGPVRLEDGCVLLPVRSGDSALGELRAEFLGGNPLPMLPHVTLLHPRNAAGMDDCLETMRGDRFPEAVVLREISMIEQDGDGAWRVLASHGSLV